MLCACTYITSNLSLWVCQHNFSNQTSYQWLRFCLFAISMKMQFHRKHLIIPISQNVPKFDCFKRKVRKGILSIIATAPSFEWLDGELTLRRITLTDVEGLVDWLPWGIRWDDKGKRMLPQHHLVLSLNFHSMQPLVEPRWYLKQFLAFAHLPLFGICKAASREQELWQIYFT